MSPRSIIFLATLVCPLFAQAQDHAIFLRELAVESGQLRVPAVSTPPVPEIPFPLYPADLLAAGVPGEAEMRFFVRADGTLANVTTLRATRPEFAAAAETALSRWRHPAERVGYGGTANRVADVWMRCRFLFTPSAGENIPSWYPEYMHARLTGRELLDLAYARAESDGVDLRAFPLNRIFITAARAAGRIVWSLRFLPQPSGAGENISIYIDDTTRAVILEREADRRSGASRAPSYDRNEGEPYLIVTYPTSDNSSHVAKPPRIQAMELPHYGKLVRYGVSTDARVRFRLAADGSVQEPALLYSSESDTGTELRELMPLWRFLAAPGSNGSDQPSLTLHIAFRLCEDDTRFSAGLESGSADIKLSGYDVIRAALARARADREDLLGKFSYAPTLRLTRTGAQALWAVIWRNPVQENGKWLDDVLRVTVDDRTRETTLTRSRESQR